MDLTESIAPKSDQLNAEDLLTGPRTFTVADVKKGSAEQPVDIHLVEFPGRPFRPSKTVRRIRTGGTRRSRSSRSRRPDVDKMAYIVSIITVGLAIVCMCIALAVIS